MRRLRLAISQTLCRRRHKWSLWTPERCDDCLQLDERFVWRMCRRCGAHEIRSSKDEAARKAASRLFQWRARTP